MQSLDLAVGDVTGDGKPDIVVVNTYEGLTVLQNNTPEILDTLPTTADSLTVDTNIVTPSIPSVAYLIDTFSTGHDTIIETTTLALTTVEHDSVLYIITETRGVGRCLGDTQMVVDTSTILLSQKFTRDSTVASVHYDTLVPTGIVGMVPENIKLYPNPFVNGINVQNLPPVCLVEVYDATGTLVYREECGGRCFIPRNSLAQGVYTINITSGGDRQRYKVVAM
jgi:hypothetical protein